MTDVNFFGSYRYEIYVGLKDQDTYEEYFTLDSFKKYFNDIVNERNISFSLTDQIGGYTHNKGYVIETSLKIMLLNVEFDKVMEVAELVKKLVNTDTVMITREKTEYSYI